MEIGDSDTDKYPHRIGNISRRIKLHDMRTVTLIIVHCSAVKLRITYFRKPVKLV
jgi:hypothetical protein